MLAASLILMCGIYCVDDDVKDFDVEIIWQLELFDLCGVDSICGFHCVDMIYLRHIASDQDPPTGRPLHASVFLLLVGA